jgi:hypothetical protein
MHTTMSVTSETTVVDLRNKHRPGGGDIMSWFENPNHVYCGRSNVYRAKIGEQRVPVPPKRVSCQWGNPFRVGKNCTAENCLDKYEEYVLGCPELMEALPSLRGKVLGCWCVGTQATCHALVLARLAGAEGKID